MSACFQTSGIQKVIIHLEKMRDWIKQRGKGYPGKDFKMCGCTLSGLKAFEELIFLRILWRLLMEIFMGGMSYIFVAS